MNPRRGMLWILALCAILPTACKPSGAEPIGQKADGQAGAEAAPRSDAAEIQLAQNGKQPGEKAKGGPMLPHPFPRRSPAPSLDGGAGWLNTAGPLDIKDLKGKFVLLDFWTYCCINCMHILPELKKLEHAYPNELVVIGVHSAKFANERDTENIRAAILRYEIEHPVVNDNQHRIWNKYAVQSWPTLRLIDPEGNLVAGNSGEIKFEELDGFLQKVMPYYRERELIDPTPLKFDMEAMQAQTTPLRFPGKILADQSGRRLFIADSNHNRIVVTDPEGKLIETIGSGAIGSADGPYATAQFDHPQGMALAGSTLYVADTENHMLRKVDLERKTVQTIAGTGKQRGRDWPGMEGLRANPGARLPDRWVGPPSRTALNSPWDVLVHDKTLFIAMAGSHQIWRMPLDESEIGPYAGNGREDIVDGPLLPRTPFALGASSFAQPSGLATDGLQLFVADSEGSSVRAVPLDPRKKVKTIVGVQGNLFDFGDADGTGSKVRLQHVLGIAYEEGKLYVADTYNSKIKLIDPVARTATTIAGTGARGASDVPAQFNEPAGLAIAGGKLYVADTNNHKIRVVDLSGGYKVSTLEIAGLTPPKAAKPAAKPSFADARPIELGPQAVRPEGNQVKLAVKLKLPLGWKINPLAPQRYLVEVEGAAGPIRRSAVGKLVSLDKPAGSFEVELPLDATEGQERLKLSLAYYYCQAGSEGLCKTGSVVWSVPLKLSAQADSAQVTLEHAITP